MSVGTGLSQVFAQQIPQFSQYMFNGLYINPAYAGYKEDMYAHLMYRKQWLTIECSPQTIMFGIDGDLGRGSNLGLIYANDQLGAVTTNSIMLAYAFRFNLSSNARLSIGLSGGALHYNLDKSKVEPDDPLLLATRGAWKPQADVGVYFDLPDFYAGFSAMGLIPNRAESNTMQIMRSVPTYFLTFGGMIHLSKEVALAPSTLLKSDFKSPLCLDLNAMIVLSERVWLGAGYRTGLNFTYKKEEASESLRQIDALVLTAEIYLTENIRLGLAYDFDLTSLTTDYNGGIEISLGYYILKPQRHYVRPRYF